MKYQPIAYVASIRESSIIMASLIGFIFLKEKFTSARFISAAMFFVGVYFIYNS
jgi:drug/metabolite transporter (DMT)-like permease